MKMNTVITECNVSILTNVAVVLADVVVSVVVVTETAAIVAVVVVVVLVNEAAR